MSSVVKVAVGVIENNLGEVLVARRQQGQHLAGLWEFPGGKIEDREDVVTALMRELQEEIAFDSAENFKIAPLITICWNYGHKKVELQVHHVAEYAGRARGNEGQEIQWVAKQKLSTLAFPPANKPILAALNLPRTVLITGEEESESVFFTKLDSALVGGIKLVQFRAKTLNKTAFQSRVDSVLTCFSEQLKNAQIIFNCPLDYFKPDWPKSIHLTSQLLTQQNIAAEISKFEFISASVHNEIEVAKANELKLDCVFCSPVKPTLSHPEAESLGWSGFSALCHQAQMPVYALGGMRKSDLDDALNNGAQGIAAISAFW